MVKPLLTTTDSQATRASKDVICKISEKRIDHAERPFRLRRFLAVSSHVRIMINIIQTCRALDEVLKITPGRFH